MRRHCAGLLVITAIAAGGCRELADPVDRRDEATAAAEVLRVGVVWHHLDEAQDGFWRGVELAKRHVDAGGGVAGRRLELARAEDGGDIAAGKRVAQAFADDPEIAAVVGHPEPDVAVVTSVMYEYAGIVHLVAGPGSRRLSRQGFSRVFRLRPTAEIMGARLADRAADRGLSRVGIALTEAPYAEAFAHAFESRAEDRRLRVVSRLPFYEGAQRFSRGLEQLGAREADGVVIVARGETGAAIANAVAAAELDVPLLAADALATEAFAALPSADGALAVTAFHPDVTDEAAAAFARAFREAYDAPPDTAAAEGYTAVRLIAAAAARAGGASSADLAEGLRGAAALPSPLGPVRFDARGERVDPPVVFVEVAKGSLRLAASVEPTPEAP